MPPPPAAGCEKVCLYVTNPLDATVSMLWVNAVPRVEDARFGHMQLDISSDLSVASDYTNLIYANDGAVSDTQTASLQGSDGLEKAFFNDNFEVFEGSSGDDQSISQASLVMNTIHDPTPDQGSGGDAPIFGYAKCQWLRHARAELPGSACSAVYGGSMTTGAVFQSAAGTMECGRLLAINNKALSAYETFSTGRCPRGSPVDTPNYAPSWTKRLLVGGCMIAADAKYSAEAEVHVPQACAVVANFMKGCLFPSALNFDPTAVQAGECTWPTIGCTDSTSYNYNPLATTDGPCIDKVAGCSIYQRMYTNLHNADKFIAGGPYSDKFQGFDGSDPLDLLPLGIWDATTVYDKATVYNYTADATDPSDCIVVVEGCMDATAANYDSMATVDSGDWCRASKSGCMDPTQSANFVTDNTVDTGCIGKVLGCTDPTAVNYMSLATQNDGSCKGLTTGCGHPKATNYDSGVTDHVQLQCVWYANSPPPPPAPPLNPGGTSKLYKTMRTILTWNIELSELLAQCPTKGPGWTKADCLALNVREKCGAKSHKHSVYPGSAIIDLELRFEDDAAASAALSSLNSGTTLADFDWGSIGAPTITASLGADQQVAFNPLMFPPAPPPGAINAPLVGGLVGGILALVIILLIVLVLYYKKVRVKKSKGSSVQPGE